MIIIKNLNSGTMHDGICCFMHLVPLLLGRMKLGQLGTKPFYYPDAS